MVALYFLGIVTGDENSCVIKKDVDALSSWFCEDKSNEEEGLREFREF